MKIVSFSLSRRHSSVRFARLRSALRLVTHRWSSSNPWNFRFPFEFEQQCGEKLKKFFVNITVSSSVRPIDLILVEGNVQSVVAVISDLVFPRTNWLTEIRSFLSSLSSHFWCIEHVDLSLVYKDETNITAEIPSSSLDPSSPSTRKSQSLNKADEHCRSLFNLFPASFRPRPRSKGKGIDAVSKKVNWTSAR